MVIVIIIIIIIINILLRWGRWDDILQHGRFKRRMIIQDVIKITRAMVGNNLFSYLLHIFVFYTNIVKILICKTFLISLSVPATEVISMISVLCVKMCVCPDFCLQLTYSLKHYEGDDRIKKFIYDLISPSEDGLEKDYKNHSGLSAPVPRGRKGKKAKKDMIRTQLDDDLTKLDIDSETVLVDESYRKHLIRQSNKYVDLDRQIGYHESCVLSLETFEGLSIVY